VQVKALLSAAKDIDAIIQAVPELSDPTTLSRSLSFLASSFRGKVGVVMWYQVRQVTLAVVVIWLLFDATVSLAAQSYQPHHL
jgi:hypothetical protein